MIPGRNFPVQRRGVPSRLSVLGTPKPPCVSTCCMIRDPRVKRKRAWRVNRGGAGGAGKKREKRSDPAVSIGRRKRRESGPCTPHPRDGLLRGKRRQRGRARPSGLFDGPRKKNVIGLRPGTGDPPIGLRAWRGKEVTSGEKTRKGAKRFSV